MASGDIDSTPSASLVSHQGRIKRQPQFHPTLDDESVDGQQKAAAAVHPLAVTDRKHQPQREVESREDLDRFDRLAHLAASVGPDQPAPRTLSLPIGNFGNQLCHDTSPWSKPPVLGIQLICSISITSTRQVIF